MKPGSLELLNRKPPLQNRRFKWWEHVTNNAVLKTVVIGKNVKTIGVNAFYGCKNLTKVSGGAALVTICDRVFSNCAVLSGIVLPSTVKGIGKQAFYNCKKLRSITINTFLLTSKNVSAQAFTGTYAKAVEKYRQRNLLHIRAF